MEAHLTDTLFDTLYTRARREIGLPDHPPSRGNALRIPPLESVCRDLPAQTAILGVCEDGIPLLLDLHDPAPGSLLVVSNAAAKARGVLMQVAASACLTSSRHQVKVAVISKETQEWGRALRGVSLPDQLDGMDAPFSLGAREKVLELARLANSRRHGRLRQPPILLIMDDLSWIADADHEIQVHLRWLLQNGPELMVWCVASLQEWAALEMQTWMQLFGTRAFGSIQPVLAKQVGAPPSMAYRAQQQDGVFEIKTREGWSRFSLADLPA